MPTEKYLDCVFESVELARTRYGLDRLVVVKQVGGDEAGKLLFVEKTFCTFDAIPMLGWDNEKAVQELERLTFARAKARLALGQYVSGETYDKTISPYSIDAQKKQPIVSEEIIQGALLTGLRNIRMKEPVNYYYQQIDVEGFCELLEISQEKYLYSAFILKEDKLVEEGRTDQLTVGNGGIFITSEGIKSLEERRTISCGPLAKKQCDCKEEIAGGFVPAKVFLDIPYSNYSDCEKVLRDILKETGLEAVIAKDKLTSNAVLCKVCSLIRTCKYGITDISSISNSVSYEYGLMHGLGMKVCLLLRTESAKFTDIHGLEHISYNGIQTFKINVCKWILENITEINKSKIQEVIAREVEFLTEKGEVALERIIQIDN